VSAPIPVGATAAAAPRGESEPDPAGASA
jgi:hypothetical protein